MRRDLTYKLTADWTSEHFANWSKWFETLAGKEWLRIAEIGSYEGRSALWFAENLCTGLEAKVICVDTWADSRVEANFKYNVAKCAHPERIIPIKGTADRLETCYPHPFFHLIYIDGDHSADWVLHDALIAWPRLREGGFLLFDDYLGFEGVRQGVEVFYKALGTAGCVEHYGKQLLLRKLGSSSTEGLTPPPFSPTAEGNGPEGT